MSNNKQTDYVNEALKNPAKRGISTMLLIANILGIIYLIKRLGD